MEKYYKTKLEELTLEELQRIVSEAPSGWEEYQLESEDYYEVYTKGNRRDVYRLGSQPSWFKPNIPDYSSKGFYTREAIYKMLDLLEYPFKNSVIEISEFINEIKFVDGKVYLDMDKQDIDGVIKMLEESING